MMHHLQDIVSEAAHDRVAPFSVYCRSMAHSFKIKLPTSFVVTHLDKSHFKHRKLFFSKLFLVPEFYSIHAAKYQLDGSHDEDDVVHLNWYARYGLRASPYPTSTNDSHRFSYQKPSSLSEMVGLINTYLTGIKPDYFKHPGAFFDWVDIKASDIDGIRPTGHAQFIESIPSFAEALYGEAYSPALHYTNVLPRSAHGVSKEVNPYAIPPLDAPLHERRRLRLWLAPNHKISFSNMKILERMGFEKEQVFRHTNQLHIVNGYSNDWLTVIAQKEPSEKEIDTESKLHLRVVDNDIISEEITFTVTRAQLHDIQRFGVLVVDHFKIWSTRLNVTWDVGFQPSTRRFEMVWPDEYDNFNVIVYFDVYPDAELSSKLNFGLSEKINSKSKTIMTTTQEAEVMSKTLAFDTGSIFVTARGASSTLETSLSHNTLAVLYPGDNGIMTLAVDSGSVCHLPPFVRAPAYALGSGTVELDFELWTFNFKNEAKHLDWPIGFFVNGILTSRV